MARINLSKGLNGGSKSRYFAKSLYPFGYLKIIALVICLLMIPALSILIGTSSVPGKSSIIDPSYQTTTTSTYPTTTPSTRGNPRPDEVDLYGNNVWKTNADVPAHNNLGFRVMSGASLTIYAGVTVKFDSGRQLFVEGQLKILGTKSSMVNLSTKSASPAKGDWGGVKYGTGSSGFINSTRIMYSTIGVNLFDAKNIMISNCTIHDSEYGMRLESTSDNNKIIKNEIFDCDTGMAILDSDNNDIIENEIYNLSILSLSMGDQANNNDIESNSLYNSGIRGISLSGNANNNSFFDNEIHTNVEDGFRFVGAPDNTLESNQIYSNKNGIISYSGSDRNILTGNSIYQNTEAGLNFVGGDEWLLSENSFSNNYYGILSSSSQGIECNNDTISVSTFADIDLNKDSELSVINCSFQKNLAFVHDSSVLKVYWYLIIEMRDDTGKLTKGKVEVKNAMDDVIRPNSWANDGICWVKCLGFIQTETGKDKSQNPYWFVVNDGEQEFNYGEDVSSQSVVFKIRFVYLPEEFSFPEDTKYEIKLSKYFNIFENQNFEIDIISGGNISYIFDEDNLKLSAKPPENWVGSETIQISATPNLGDADIEITRFNVTPVNDPPNIIQLIPNQLKKEGAPSWTLDLTEYGFDVDLEFGDSLTWSVSEVNESLLNITVLDNGQVLRFSLASPDNYGNNRVNIWVEDNYGESDSQYIWINVTPENDGPILKDMAVLPKSGSPSDNFNFSVQYFDPDGDLPDYIIIKINNKITYQLLETNINDKNVIDGKEYYYQMKLSSQEYFFWFECQDSYGIFAKSDRVSGPIVAIAELGSLNGWVRDKETGSPIADSEITVNDLQNSSFQVKVQTGFDGNYTVLNLQPGINRYQIYAQAVQQNHHKRWSFNNEF
jgi:parallel beta-helix repeat protein